MKANSRRVQALEAQTQKSAGIAETIKRFWDERLKKENECEPHDSDWTPLNHAQASNTTESA